MKNTKKRVRFTAAFIVSLLLIAGIAAMLPVFAEQATELVIENGVATNIVWNNGFVGSSTNAYGYVDKISNGNQSSAYRYTDIITVPKAGTMLTWTEPVKGSSMSSNAYIISTWKLSGSTWVLDKEGVNIAGIGRVTTSIMYYDMKTGYCSYSYVTQKDNEHLRLGCYGQAGTAGGTTVYAGNSAANSSNVIENVLWLPGYIGSARHSTAASRNAICPYSTYEYYTYSNPILIPKAGSTISFSVTVDGTNIRKLASYNSYVFSKWERHDDHSFSFSYGMEGNDNVAGVNTAWQTLNGNVCTYSYTSSYDNEYIRLCFEIDSKEAYPSNLPTVTLTESSGNLPTLSTAYFDPANADFIRSVSWNGGYVGSAENDGNANKVYKSNDFEQYKYSDIFPVWGKDTLVMFTDRSSGFADASKYVISSFTGESNTLLNVDTGSANIKGDDATHYTDNPDGSRTYFYYTTKDVEYLRLCVNANGGSLTNPSENSTFIPPAVYVLPSARLVKWNTGGYIIGNPTVGDMYSESQDNGFMYSDYFTVPQAGTQIQIPLTADSNDNIALFSTYAVNGGDTVGATAIRPSQGGFVSVGNTRLYTYTTQGDNETVRICTNQNYTPVTGSYFLPILVSKLGDHASLFDGKEMVIMGDSYFEGYFIGKDKVWPAQLAQVYGMTFYNHGVNGSSISSYVTTNNPMVDRVDKMSGGESTDLVLFEGGRNDYNKDVPLGKLGDTNPKTFYGAVHTVLTKLLAKYPNALVVCLNPWNMTGHVENDPNGAGHTSNDYAMAFKAYVESLDNDRVTMLNSNSTEVVPVFLKDASFRLLYAYHSNDISHMNVKGMKYALPYFEELIADYMSKSEAVNASGGIKFEENGTVYRLLGSDVESTRKVTAPMLQTNGVNGWGGQINGEDVFYPFGSTIQVSVGDSGTLTPTFREIKADDTVLPPIASDEQAPQKGDGENADEASETSAETESMPDERNSSPAAAIIIVTAVLAVGAGGTVGGILLYRKKKNKS